MQWAKIILGLIWVIVAVIAKCSLVLWGWSLILDLLVRSVSGGCGRDRYAWRAQVELL